MDSSGPAVKPWKVWIWVAPVALLAIAWGIPHLLHAPVHAEDDEKEKAVRVPLTAADLVVVSGERLPETIQANGTLEALPNGRAVLSSEIAGRLLDLSLKPGDSVRAGQPVARVQRTDLAAETEKAAATVAEARREVTALEAQLPLQAATLDAQARQATAAKAEAQAKLDQLRAGSRAEEIDRAQAQLAAAQSDLDRLNRGARPQELRQAEAALREADAEVEVASREATRMASLVEKGVAAGRDRERADANLAQAQARQASARAALDLVKQGPRPEEIEAQRARVRDAEASLRLVKAGARPEELRQAQAALSQAEAKLAEVDAGRRQADVTRAQIEAARQRHGQALAAQKAATALAGQAVVRAPIGGIVSRTMAAVGEVVQPGSPIAEIQSGEALRLMLQVPAAHLSRLKAGLPVTVTLPHEPGVTFDGTVRVVSPGASTDTGTITAEVWLPNRDRRLQPGMAVTAEIRAAAGSVLPSVPVQTVFSLEGEHYVYRLEDGEIRQAKVTLGTERGDHVQVLAGLHPGDRILADGHRSIPDKSEFEGVPGEKGEAAKGEGAKAEEGGAKGEKDEKSGPSEKSEKSEKETGGKEKGGEKD